MDCYTADRISDDLHKILPNLFMLTVSDTITVELRSGTNLTFNQLTKIRDVFHTHDIAVKSRGEPPANPDLEANHGFGAILILEINNWAVMKPVEV